MRQAFDVRPLIRKYFADRVAGVEHRSLADLLTEVRAKDPEAFRRLWAAMWSGENPVRESERQAHIQACRTRDLVDFGVELSPGMPPDAHNFNDFHVSPEYPKLAEALEATWVWLHGEGPGLLTLAGDPGVGKTHLAKAAAKEITSRGFPIIYRTEGGLIAELQRLMNQKGPETAIQELLTVPWLVVDDLGTTALGDWGKGTMDRIINARWEGSTWLRTLITTNFSSKDLPERIASRLADITKARAVAIQAPDYRRRSALADVGE